jgi:predicted Zn-dependent protease
MRGRSLIVLSSVAIATSVLSLLRHERVAAEPASTAAAAATDSQEIALGAALARQFDIDRGIQPTPETQRIEAYLQTIADSLATHARRHLPWRIHFDPHPGLKSGFALPGGHIVIWGGILAYMTTEDEAAAIIAHEIEHIDDGQVSRRIDSLVRTAHRDVSVPSQWTWDEFGASYGPTLENLCDYKGAKLAVQAGYSPYGYKTLLESFVALGKVHAPKLPAPHAIVVRIDQIEREIAEQHWQSLTRTRPLQLPGNGN